MAAYSSARVLAPQGYIALHLAAQAGHTDVVSLLLSKKAALLKVRTKQGRTSLHLAASHGHLDMASLLVGQGSDVDAYDKVRQDKKKKTAGVFLFIRFYPFLHSIAMFNTIILLMRM